MSSQVTLAILSDIHYAGAAERARGPDYEFAGISNPLVRWPLKLFRHFVWMRHPLEQGHALNPFFDEVGTVDFVVANGDYSCNTAFIGVGDDAACESANECLGKLRERFGEKFRATIGDHELGKFSFAGARGGMRLASFRRALTDLRLQPFWKLEIGQYVLIGITSSLIALPVFEPDTLPEERAEWVKLRAAHLAEICSAFEQIKPSQRILLFCHDPTALPFLAHEESVRNKLPQIEQTIIGHLHTKLVFWKSHLLAGMPAIRFLGHTAKRMTTALHDARYWKPFHVRLCPALSGIELLKNGGFFKVTLHPDSDRPPQFCFHPLARCSRR